MNVWDSNHIACEAVGVDLFKHLQAKRLLNLFYFIMYNKSPYFSKMKYYFRFCSNFKFFMQNIFENYYGVTNTFSNAKCAIKSRIDFVQRNEPVSSYGINLSAV